VIARRGALAPVCNFFEELSVTPASARVKARRALSPRNTSPISLWRLASGAVARPGGVAHLPRLAPIVRPATPPPALATPLTFAPASWPKSRCRCNARRANSSPRPFQSAARSRPSGARLAPADVRKPSVLAHRKPFHPRRRAIIPKNEPAERDGEGPGTPRRGRAKRAPASEGVVV